MNGAPAFSMHRKYVCMYAHTCCTALRCTATCCSCLCMYRCLSTGRGRQKQPLSNDKGKQTGTRWVSGRYSIHPQQQRIDHPTPCPHICTRRRASRATAHGTLWWAVVVCFRCQSRPRECHARPSRAASTRRGKRGELPAAGEWRQQRQLGRTSGDGQRQHAGSRWTRLLSLVVAAPWSRQYTAAIIRREALAPSF